MSYKKLFGYGIAVWAVPYILAMGLFAYKVINTTWATLLLLAAGAAAAYFAGRALKLGSAGKILKYSLGWAVIAVILDILLTIPFTGWQYFFMWNAWVAYALVVLVPLAAKK